MITGATIVVITAIPILILVIMSISIMCFLVLSQKGFERATIRRL